MTTAATALTHLKAYTHKQGDDMYLKDAIVKALWELRNIRTRWNEGTFKFYTENSVDEYEVGVYPGLPSDLLSIDTARISFSPLIYPVSSPSAFSGTPVNLTAGYAIADLQDRPHDPDDTWVTPDDETTDSSFVLAFSNMPTADLRRGSFHKVRVLAAATPALGSQSVDITVADSGGTVATASYAASELSTAGVTLELLFNSRNLAVSPPTALTVTVEATSDATNSVKFGAVEIVFDVVTTAGNSAFEQRNLGIIREMQGSGYNQVISRPSAWAMHHDHIIMYPTPGGPYAMECDYLKDSSVDETTEERITVSGWAGTETNEWFRRGFQILLAKAQEIYFMERLFDVEKATMARTRYLNYLESIDNETTMAEWHGTGAQAEAYW